MNGEYNESVVVAPRNFNFSFRHIDSMDNHPAIIGMAVVINNTPLFFDGCNEHGVAMAGLNFPKSCRYNKPVEGMKNILSAEMISYVLSNAHSVDDAERLLEGVNITDEGFLSGMPTSPLHWIISDKTRSIVVEQTDKGLNIYNDDIEVLTNEPEFPIHIFNLKNYSQLRRTNPETSIFGEKEDYCLGLGTVGLPGDYSSPSRFVRTSYLKACSSKESSVVQFMHILDAVSFQRGTVLDESGKEEVTYYSSCMDTDEGLYYYKTYDNPNVAFVDLKEANIDSEELQIYPLMRNFEPIRQYI